MSATACVADRGMLRLSRGREVAYAAPMNSSPDDSALMLRYRDGDAEAFDTLYRRHNDSLYRYLLRLCRQRDTAEDLYQEVWSKIIRTRERYRPTAKFATFLYRVAYNCFVDHVRRNKRYSGGDPPVEPATDPSDAPETLAEHALARKKMLAALATLPDEQRDAFLLREEAGLKLDAIAEVTGVNRETVKSRLRYANGKLKSALLQHQSGNARDNTRAPEAPGDE